MLTNQGACVCLLLLLSWSNAALDHWSLQNGTMYPSQGNFEIDTENLKVIITVTNSMYHLDLGLTTMSNVIQVEAEQADYDSCQDDFRPDVECQNYPRVLVLPEGAWPMMSDDGTVWNVSNTVLSCGSNAFSPRCYYRNRSDLQLLKVYSSSHFNPFGPSDDWVPGMWISTGRLIVATPQDALFTKFGITMSEVPFDGNVQATTRTNQRLWFNKTPNFVSMYEIGEYLYVFFREEAVEADERVIYSRVARICKNDMGTLHEDTLIFTTYVKARISCTSSHNARLSGVTYHYNDLYGTHYIPEEQRLYAVFRSPQNGPLGSVVCSYTFGTGLHDLDTVFSRDYLVEQGTDRFVTERNFDPFTCAEGRDLVDADGNQLMIPVLMSPVVTQTTAQPTLMVEGHAFQRIVTDRVDSEREVLFITALRESDNALVLLKVMVTTVDNVPTYHMIRTTDLPTTTLPDSTPRVTKMEIYRSGPSASYVYIGTESDIYRVPIQDCATMYTTCCECVGARDPYCAFDATSGPPGSCVPLDGRQSLLQDLTGGDSDICTMRASSVDETQTSDAPSTTSRPTVGKVCAGGVTPTGPGGDIGAGGDIDGTTDAATGPVLVTHSGLQGRLSFLPRNQVWIIVGTVGGFIGGVVLGIVVAIVCKHCRIGRRNKTSDLIRPRAITNDTTVHPGRNKKGGVAPGGQSREEMFRINNSTEFSTSNNFTRSANDYTRHIPPHLKDPQSPIGYPLKDPQTPIGYPHKDPQTPVKNPRKDPQTPVKYPCKDPQTPVKYPTTPEGPPTITKCIATPSPPPGKYPPSVFTFTPASIPHSCHTPSSMAGASGASSASSDGSYQEPGGGGGDKPTHNDPNLQLNYKARVYLTNSQREAYGRNILARMPSIDGSKSKYTGIVEMPGRVSSSAGSPGMYASDSLPRRVSYHRRQDVVPLDAELGCSQC